MNELTLTGQIGKFIADKLKAFRQYVDNRFANLTIRGDQITSGFVHPERLPKSTTYSIGIVKLTNELTDDSTVAVTPAAVKNAVKEAMDAITLDGSDKYFRHDQGVPSSIWHIVHNMGKRPSITVTDTAGTKVEGQVEYISDSEIRITFSAAFSGYAELN